MPRRAAAGNRGSGGAPTLGVPWSQTHRQAALGTIGHGVVRVQCAPVAQQQIGLRHHLPSIPSDREQTA